MHDTVRSGEALSIHGSTSRAIPAPDPVREILNRVTPTPRAPGPRMDPDTARTEIARRYREIMEILGLDLSDDSLARTPQRVAKMYVDEIFRGLRDDQFPSITAVENKMGYDRMLLETNIAFESTCEHHFLPVIGKAHIAYVPADKVLGLSKFNRVVDFFARRPQVQERATVQIREALSAILETENVAVVVDAIHCCVRLRGVGDAGTVTRTSSLSGDFRTDAALRSEFLSALPSPDRLSLR